ncbi:PilN domain-containing protein [Leptolyngbya sp. 7M]|uniref:PilN domain-containing protein n=1 Tax=Leptolyngbya sp. 7M TaxID=2812896 RepID=UPI001B8D0985|nr:PilN domain-containing protein [Leptolyngbya sp. 7M]QYO66598.1 PilN domain-containing protein [Leptolyngbya sp. 7M]
MIKVNLLNSVTERQGSAVAAVDRKVSSPASRLLLLTLAVGFLLAAVVGWDVISSHMARNRAEQEKAEQQQIQKELEVVMKEQQELEQKIKNIDMRIEAIKKLRANQAGPSAVLEAMRERIAMVPGLYLKSIEQSGDVVTITGNSPDESVVTQFGRSLEFSNGLFSNLNIETRREEMTNQMASAPASGGEAPKVNVINFTIKTNYTPSKAPSPDANPTTASAAPNQGGSAVQVAKN